MAELTLTTLSQFGQLTEREAAIAKSAATQGWEGAMKTAVAALPDTIKRLDAATIRKNFPLLWKSIAEEGWNLAHKSGGVGARGLTGLLPMAEVIKLANALKGPDLKIDFPDPAPVTIVNNPPDIEVKY